MECRLANLEDLEKLKEMYTGIVKNMEDNNIFIWDEIYPCEFLKQDIVEKRFYILIQEDEILSSFALCASHAGADQVQWRNPFAVSLYLDRFAVHVKYSHKGFGCFMIEKAKEIAKEKGYEALRLFVVDVNIPAIRLYKKNGFQKADGLYDEVFDDGFVLHEYGYEIKLSRIG